MRLRRLDLIRYGKFTDRVIDFGQRLAGQPDLHVIYGPNEAGKSTAFAAFLDLLFGIGPQSPYDFLHPYSTMRVGGALEVAGETHEFARIKRQQNSLLDMEGRPIPETAIRGELGGIERDAYRMMFSLDDETLEKGGESILASKGDLGQLLFSASAGLAHLSHKLVELRGEADGFYKYRARSGKLADFKARLVDLKTEREQFDTLASEHARLVETRDRARAQYDEAIAGRAGLQARMDEIQRHLGVLPRLAALRSLRERLEPLAGVPDAPPEWAQELPALRKAEIELGVQARSRREDVARLADEVEAIVVDEAALQLTERVERLAELRARHVTAEKDIPERRLEVRQLGLVISGILQRIEREGEADPARLVLTAATVGRLRDLIEARSGIDAAIRNAARELADARSRLAETAAKLPAAEPGAAPERDHAMAELATTVAALRSSDHAARGRLAEGSRSAARETLDDRLRALRPWQGTADDLAGMCCPGPDAVRHWKVARTEAETVLARHGNDVERLTTQVRHLEAERASYALVAGVLTDREAADIRASREQAWAAHRRDLDTASADAFEAALRRDDMVGAGRFSHMSELAKLHQSGRALAVAQADLDRAAELKDGAAGALSGLDTQVEAAVRFMWPSLAASLTLVELEAWLGRRDKALEAREAARSADRDLRAAQTDAAAAQDRMRVALDRAGVPHEADGGFDALLATAQAALDREAEVQRLRAELRERERDVAAREGAARQAQADEDVWAEAWAGACDGCWLGDMAGVPAVGVVREILAAIADLGPTIEKQAGFIDRIGKMEKDQAAFRDEVTSLADGVGIPAEGMPLLDAAQRIAEKVRQAGAERGRQADLAGKLAEAEGHQRALADAVSVHEVQKSRMTTLFSVASLDEVAARLADIEQRRQLRAAADEAGQEILDAIRASSLADAEAALDGLDRAALDAELIELKARFEDQDQRCQELFAARSAAADKVEAIGGDAKVAEIEERRRTTLLEIEDGAMRYFQLRAGIVATERALASYREHHRSSMMQRASAAFSTISRGAYRGLAAQPGKDGETLIALSSAGGSKAADELSKGTRFQLYLALRVAGYQEFVRSRSTVPFVADDIMETFDDFRAEEAFRLFAEMAQAGQVIYLTHHQHLCEIVKKICPSVRLHRLDAPALESARA